MYAAVQRTSPWTFRVENVLVSSANATISLKTTGDAPPLFDRAREFTSTAALEGITDDPVIQRCVKNIFSKVLKRHTPSEITGGAEIITEVAFMAGAPQALNVAFSIQKKQGSTSEHLLVIPDRAACAVPYPCATLVRFSFCSGNAMLPASEQIRCLERLKTNQPEDFPLTMEVIGCLVDAEGMCEQVTKLHEAPTSSVLYPEIRRRLLTVFPNLGTEVPTVTLGELRSLNANLISFPVICETSKGLAGLEIPYYMQTGLFKFDGSDGIHLLFVRKHPEKGDISSMV